MVLAIIKSSEVQMSVSINDDVSEQPGSPVDVRSWQVCDSGAAERSHYDRGLSCLLRDPLQKEFNFCFKPLGFVCICSSRKATAV